MSSLSDVKVSLDVLAFTLSVKETQLAEPMHESTKASMTARLQEQVQDLKRGIAWLQQYGATISAGGGGAQDRHNSLPQDCIPSCPSPAPSTNYPEKGE